MAKRATRKSTSIKDAAKKRKAPPPLSDDTVLDAALRCAARDGWRAVTLADIAAEAATNVEAVEALYPTKAAVVRGLLGRVDDKAAASLEEAPMDGSSARDRLFDLLMRRFDALACADYPDAETARAGMVAIIRDQARDPKAVLCLMPRMLRTMAAALDAAGPGSRGPCGALRVKGLGLVYGDTLRTFLGDDGADMAKTMAALDRGLRRAEGAARFFGWAR